VPPTSLIHNTRSLYDNHHVALANEFRTLASLRHPYIISVLDFGFDEYQKPHFTMTFLDSAENLLVATRNKPLNQQVQIINQILQSLVYLHRRGIIHREMKPANVLVTNQQVKVLDFGLSIATEVGKDRVGTLAYMAPETLTNGTAIAASDLYSVGVMMYQIFVDALPYEPNDIIGRIQIRFRLQKCKTIHWL
jgi:serine/threonine protein kinase